MTVLEVDVHLPRKPKTEYSLQLKSCEWVHSHSHSPSNIFHVLYREHLQVLGCWKLSHGDLGDGEPLLEGTLWAEALAKLTVDGGLIQDVWSVALKALCNFVVCESSRLENCYICTPLALPIHVCEDCDPSNDVSKKAPIMHPLLI